MYSQVDTRYPTEVELAVQRIYRELYPTGDRFLVSRAFDWFVDCFCGRYRNYQPIDALYHDLEHTLQGALCMVRLLHGRHKAKVDPPLSLEMFELGLLSILLHDTGYLKTRDDTEGTGAKYTLTHVNRSADFAAILLTEKGYSKEAVAASQHMIRCTGVNVDLKAVPFADDLERFLGFALGTSDLLGQMAAHDYIDKLPILYLEFVESGRYSGLQMALGNFTSAEDLMKKTPAFWEKFVLPKVVSQFEGAYRFLNDPYPDGPNFYFERIEANIRRLRTKLAASAEEAKARAATEMPAPAAHLPQTEAQVVKS